MAGYKMIPIAKPFIGEEEAKAAGEAIRSGWITQGPMVKKFEDEFAAYVGSKYAVAVSSCTTALHLALLCAGIGEKDEVICPSLSFIATSNSILYCGAVPVFVDIDPLTYNMDPAKIEAAITPKTKAILIVHQIGLPADLDIILGIAKRHNLQVVEDAACAIGAVYKGKKIGAPHGNTACFSFHPRKIITTGEGGMVTTNSRETNERLRLLRQHGMSVSDVERHKARKVVFEQYVEVGYNYRMTDIQAAIGLEQLKKLDAILKGRREKAAYYTEKLARLGWIKPPHCPDYAEHTYQSYMAMVTEKTKVTRDKLMEILLNSGIASRRGIMSIHLEPAYKNFKFRQPLTESTKTTSNAVILPLYHTLERPDQDRIIKIIEESPKNA